MEIYKFSIPCPRHFQAYVITSFKISNNQRSPTIGRCALLSEVSRPVAPSALKVRGYSVGGCLYLVIRCPSVKRDLLIWSRYDKCCKIWWFRSLIFSIIFHNDATFCNYFGYISNLIYKITIQNWDQVMLLNCKIPKITIEKGYIQFNFCHRKKNCNCVWYCRRACSLIDKCYVLLCHWVLARNLLYNGNIAVISQVSVPCLYLKLLRNVSNPGSNILP